jgi:hypothetical protein
LKGHVSIWLDSSTQAGWCKPCTHTPRAHDENGCSPVALGRCSICVPTTGAHALLQPQHARGLHKFLCNMNDEWRKLLSLNVLRTHLSQIRGAPGPAMPSASLLKQSEPSGCSSRTIVHVTLAHEPSTGRCLLLPSGIMPGVHQVTHASASASKLYFCQTCPVASCQDVLAPARQVQQK